MGGKLNVVINSDVDKSYDRLFGSASLYHESNPDSPYIPWDEINLVLLVGHITDVDPNLYGEVASDKCGTVDRLQDLNAFRYIDIARQRGIPVIGICKGAQQLCVYHGGTLIQHVKRVGSHAVTDGGTFTMSVRADHHQVMVPPEGYPVELYNLEEGYPEAISYEDGQHIAIQYHPEWSTTSSEPRRLFSEIIKNLMED